MKVQVRFYEGFIKDWRNRRGMNSDHDQETLRKVLHEWRLAPLPPRFQEQVWQRIEGADPAPRPSNSLWGIVNLWIETMLPKPALAVSYVAVLLAVGLTVGWTQANQQNSRVRQELGERYVQTLDPNQAMRK